VMAADADCDAVSDEARRPEARGRQGCSGRQSAGWRPAAEGSPQAAAQALAPLEGEGEGSSEAGMNLWRRHAASAEFAEEVLAPLRA